MNITVQNANAYFSGRTMGDMWSEYSGEQKQAAIQEARRDLSRALRRPIRDDEPPYREGDSTRDEYAVYEQALYSLLKYAEPKGTGAATPSLNGDETRPKSTRLEIGGGKWSMEALAWLADKMSVVTRLA